MASIATVPSEQHKVKPSFAKVAASSYKPQSSTEKPTIQDTMSKPQSAGQMRNSEHQAPPSKETQTVRVGHEGRVDTERKGGTAATRTGQWANAAGQASPHSGPKNEEVEKQPPVIALVKSLTAEDSGTQLSSSDGSAKPPSLDGKSVASATTFALDEKESIRPDDSASLRAVEEEDITSPPDSVAAGSRVGSDNGAARAFQDQLHEIAVLGPQQRGAPPGRFPNLNASGAHTLYDPSQPTNAMNRPMSQPVANGMPNMTGPHVAAVPDDKLIEALASPRDRLFVLKLEQDFIDFIKDSRESEFVLPNCNTFYRMLAHRLADYYLLGHMVDDTMTGVKISRTAFCRIPPPLSGLSVSSKSTNTPPVDLPARKIMRRGEDGKSGTNTTANSEGPSKTTSEVGGGSSDGGNDPNDGENKEKSALTREEREARYREARQRIFGNSDTGENETVDAGGSGEEKDVSRSSSASGRKKNKKQRNYDDDFEARSRFNAYYPQQYPMPGYNGDHAVFYGGYAAQMQGPQFSGVNSNIPSPSSYGGTYPPMMPSDAQGQYGWAGQQYGTPNGPMGYPTYNTAQNGYDLSPEFQRGMQSFQSAGLPSQITPKMSNTPMAAYQDPFQAQPMPTNGAWPQMNQQPTYSAQAPYSQNSPNSRPMSAPMQAPMSGQYPYGQFPATSYNGVPNRNQHPLPGSFNRQQFNPQSQTFIPGGRNGPYPMQSTMAPLPPQGMNGYASYPPNQSPNQMQTTSPAVSHPQTYGSSSNIQNGNSTISKPSKMSPAHNPQLATSQPAGTPTSSSSSSTSIPAQSSIAKWGTPSHLPPKPPAPAQQQPPKFQLPGTNNPSLPRVPNNMPAGLPAQPSGPHR